MKVMKGIRFRGPPELKDRIYAIVRKTKYNSLSDFVRKAVVKQLEIEEKKRNLK